MLAGEYGSMEVCKMFNIFLKTILHGNDVSNMGGQSPQTHAVHTLPESNVPDIANYCSYRALEGMRVVDSTGLEIGHVEGVNIDLADYNAYLRVHGERTLKLCGHMDEFVPMSEVERINGEVRLYNNLAAICYVRRFSTYSHEFYNALEIIGLNVVSRDNKVIGRVVDVGVSRDDKRPLLVVGGPQLAAIRGRSMEMLPFYDVDRIKNTVRIDLDYDILKLEVGNN
jgi:sporulation protein YlmC with PRC-barrel domain